jgi:HK97 family phage major capsid protein
MSSEYEQRLREERAGLHKEAQEISQRAVDEKRDPTAEEEARVDKLLDRVEELGRKVDASELRRERLAQQQAELEEKEERIVKLTGDRDFDAEEQAEREQRAYTKYISNQALDAEDREALRESRAIAQQLKGQNAQGGITVPTEVRASVIEQMKAFGGMRRSRATIVSTDHGRNIVMPTVDDTGNLAVIVAEATAVSNSTHVPFGSFTLEAAKYTTGPIKISSELAQDSPAAVDEIVRRSMSIRFGRATEAHYATRSSTEASGPHGLVNASTGNVVFTQGATDSLYVNDLIDLVHSVDPAYRANGEWMFNDATFKKIRKLKDTQDQFLWQPGLRAGESDQLLGYPFIVNQELGSASSTPTKFIWFGDFSAYFIRDVNDVAIRRLDERYADEDVYALIAFMRTDGRPGFATSTAALKPIQAGISSTA